MNVTAQDFREVLDPIVEELNDDLPPNHIIRYDGVITESKEAQDSLSAKCPFGNWPYYHSSCCSVQFI